MTAPSDCTECPNLCESRTQVVNGAGDYDADLMFVGEAPGQDEDEQGEPFVGQSGSVLDSALEDTPMTRGECFITNTVRCRPEGNRDPTVSERTNCFGYLKAEMHDVDPDLIMTLGKVPTDVLMPHENLAVTKDAGEIVELDPLNFDTLTFMVNMHPAATMYGAERRETFDSAVAKAVEYVRD